MKKPSIHYDRQNDFYKLLEVSPVATADEVQQAYRKLAKTLHPDLNPERREWATEQFQRVNEAYNILSDPEQRVIYDQKRAKSLRKSPPKSDVNWWDVPHPKHPNYEKPSAAARRPVYPSHQPPSPLRGAWLNRLGLGTLRPVYLAIAGVYDSPYRLVLWVLTVIVLINAGVIAFALFWDGASGETTPTPNPSLIPLGAQPVVGDIPPTAVPTSTTLTITPCDEQYVLTVMGVEKPLGLVKITAVAPVTGLMSQNVQVRRVQINADQQTALPLAAWEAAELVFLTSAAEKTAPDPIMVTDLVPGEYLLQWTPRLPDSSILRPCNQVLRLER